MMDEGYFKKVWSLADFRHHSAQYGIQKVPSDWRLHSMKYTPVGVDIAKHVIQVTLNRPGFPGECFICELRLPDHRFRWKHNKLFLLLPEEYGPAFPAIVDCYTSPPT